MSSKKKFLVNSGWMIGQQIYSMILSLVVGALSARYLGPSNFGLINYGASLISFFTTLSQLGIGGIIVNEMIKKPEKQGSYLGTALIMRLIMSILSVPSLMIIICFLEPNNSLLHTVVFLQSIAIMLQSYEVLVYWFQMELKMQVVSLATMLALTLVSIWKIVLLVNERSVEWFAFSTSIQALVGGICVFVIFIKKSKLRLHVSIGDAKYILKHSSNYIVADLAIILYTQIDKLMLGKMINEKELGYYSAAANLASMWMFVAAALIDSSRSIIISYKQTDQEVYIKRFKQLLMGVTLISVFFGIAFTFLGWLAVYIIYGKAYIPAAMPLSLLVWANMGAILGHARSIWIAAENYYKYPKYFTIFGAVLNVALNYIFILNMGKNGAALATLITQFVVLLGFPILFKETRKFLKIYFDSFRYFPDVIRSGKEMIVSLLSKIRRGS